MKRWTTLEKLIPAKSDNVLKMKTVCVNFKIIPYYIDSETRVMDRKLILNSHTVFTKERKKTIYNDQYLQPVFENWHKNKRNYSGDRLHLDRAENKKLALLTQPPDNPNARNTRDNPASNSASSSKKKTMMKLRNNSLQNLFTTTSAKFNARHKVKNGSAVPIMRTTVPLPKITT